MFKLLTFFTFLALALAQGKFEESFLIDAVSVNGLNLYEGITALVDTTYQALALPEGVYYNFNRALGFYFNGDYAINCQNVSILPDISFVVGDVTYKLTAEGGYLRRITDKICISYIFKSRNDTWLLGNLWVKQNPSIVDEIDTTTLPTTIEPVTDFT